MCGIAGIVSPYPEKVMYQRLKTMTDAIAHRGPDGEGHWVNDMGTVGFGHRRLAVVDVSPKAGQPFRYLHYTIVYNGEVYNYVELRDELMQKGYAFATRGDTEVVCAAFDHWGQGCLQRFDGMFAFMIYDERKSTAWAARDRFGEKPFYYNVLYSQRGRFDQMLFASEMKALWAVGAGKELNGTMALNYLTLGMVQNPIKNTQTFYASILSLPPGHALDIVPAEGKIRMQRWYRPENNWKEPFPGTWQDALAEFSRLFDASVERRLRSDVRTGASLSGGIDSGSIVAAIGGLGPKGFRTYSAVFPGFEKDESKAVGKTIAHIGKEKLDPVFLTPTSEDLDREWSAMASQQEEPLQSGSALVQWMVYKTARQNGTKVLVDGQGADEILGGYLKYVPWYLQGMIRKKETGFFKERKAFAHNGFLPQWDLRNYAAAAFPRFASERLQVSAVTKQKLHPFLDKSFLEKYQNPDTLLKPRAEGLEDQLRYSTFAVGLQELLRYADRSSMAHGVEIRLPFLEPDLVRLLFSLPPSFLLRNGFTKWLLRKSIEYRLPADIVWSKGKIGFEPPQADWLQSPIMTERIREARKKLVGKGIFLAKHIDAPVRSLSAHAGENHDWRALSMAEIL